MKWYRYSVCPSILLLQVCCCGLGGQEISIDCRWYCVLLRSLTYQGPRNCSLDGAKIPSHEGAGFGDTQGRYTQHYLQGAVQGDATT